MLEKPCKEFAGFRNKNGYGVRSVKKKLMLAHRLAYCEHHCLQITDITGKVVRHACDNPPCIEPSHLILGTQRENFQDMMDRNRQAKGASQHFSKLTDELVLEIRNDRSAGVTLESLAAKHGVDPTVIHSAVCNRTWKHVGGPTETPKDYDSTNTKRGSTHHLSKFVDADIINIRRRYAEGETLSNIAKAFSVASSTIYFIVKRRTWTHVTDSTPVAPSTTRQTKLSQDEIAEIVAWQKQSKPTHALMAIWFGVSIATIFSVVHGKKTV